MSQADVWDLFVGDGLAISTALAGSVAALEPDVPDEDARFLLERLGQQAFSLAAQGLLVGIESVGLLALAIEKTLDGVADGTLNPALAIPQLAASTSALQRAFQVLANPDESGARLEGAEGAQVEAARFELESMLPLPGGRPSDAGKPVTGYDVPTTSLRRGRQTTPAPAGVPVPEQSAAQILIEARQGQDPEAEPTEPEADPEPTEPEADPESGNAPAVAGQVWQPTVDADMVELFFEEVGERLDDLSVKMLEIEGRPNDEELVRDIFRDLHTVKGSSAMVALDPMNQLAHAAEDLVGHLREKTRKVDAAIIDALLAAVDGLRNIAAAARAGDPITVDTDALIDRVRDPNATPTGVSSMPPSPTASVAKGKAERTAKQTIRVDFDKLDRLMNLVGELVLGRDSLRTAISSIGSVTTELGADRSRTRRIARGTGSSMALSDELRRVERVLSEITAELDGSSDHLDSVSGELREQVMKLRMVPIGGIFRKHHRTVRDIGNSTGKSIRLVTAGEDTELDKLLVESLDEPLMHLIRNACDHGIETPAERERAGKPVEGTIAVSARHQGNQVVVEIDDDGGGIDPELIRARAIQRNLISPEDAADLDHKDTLELIFASGFSTAEQVSDLSGRGVGMDVVRQTIMTKLKGSIDIESVLGEGSRFTLRLPLTLAIIQVLLVRAGGEVFAVPLDAIVRSTTRRTSEVERLGDRDVIEVQGRQVPLIPVARVLELDQVAGVGDNLHIILSQYGDELFGLVVDGLIEKKEIVIKPLGKLLEGTPCSAGATLLGDRPALIIDVPALIRRAQRRSGEIPLTVGQRSKPIKASSDDSPLHILLVDDSENIREALRRLLVEAGYRVTTARDGVEGYKAALAGEFDLISTDVMMPRMDGYELTRKLRSTPSCRDIPIVMVTSRGERIDRVRGFDAGVDEYITKPHDRHELVRAVRKLIGGKR